MASPIVDVYVKFPSGKAFEIQLHPNELVSAITKKIAKDERIPERIVRLKYQGKVVDKTKTIGYLGICAETILKVEVLEAKDWRIQVNFEGGTHSIPVQSTETVTQLKGKITEATSVSPAKMLLKLERGGIIGGRDDDQTLVMDTGIANNSTLTLSLRSTGEPSTNGGEPKDEPDEEVQQGLLSSFDCAGKNVEVVFCFDTTGSMYSYLDRIRLKLRATCERLLRDIPNIRIGIMAHGDYCDYDNYVVRYVDLTSQSDVLVDFAKNVPRTSGGDSPECYEWALRKAQQMDWSENSAKAFVMIGDCLPHPPSYTDQNVHWMSELDVLSGMGVKVYGVQAGTLAESVPFYQELAASSGGYYLKLNNFDLITDMFLAVCYRESDQEQLDAFMEEVETAGRMTKETKVLLDALEDKKPDRTTGEEEEHSSPNSGREQRYVHAAWWDPQLDSGSRPQYSYNPDNDKWKQCERGTRSSNRTAAGSSPSDIDDSTSSSGPGYRFRADSASSKKKGGLRRLFCLA